MKPILDIYCDSCMFYFDKQDGRVLFNDIIAEKIFYVMGEFLK